MAILNDFVAYAKQKWENLPSRKTPITAERLNHMEAGIEANSNAINTMANNADKALDTKMTRPAKATVGQIIEVESIDESGRPLTFKAVPNKGVTPDLAVNDAEVSGYVANRTHWKEYISSAGTVLGETTVTFKNSLMSVTGIGSDNIKAGGQYTVHWNGTAYECTAYMQGQSTMLGNGALNGGEDDTGEPFCIEALTGNASMITKNTSDAEAVIICVEGRDSIEWHTLDPKYIKDMYYEEEVNGVITIFETTLYQSEFGTMPERDEKISLEEGEMYTIICNGKEYTKVAKRLITSGVVLGVAIGNDVLLAMLVGEDVGVDDLDESDVPIAVISFSDAAEADSPTMLMDCFEAYGIVPDTDVPITVVQKNKTVIHKIDQKYLPETEQFADDTEVVFPEQAIEFTDEEGYGAAYIFDEAPFVPHSRRKLYNNTEWV